ncbi:hypothetical protein EHS25_000606 [Saitozyma podzolica]|uniref:T6SS Phospholipase effector Tle1-like catalytic domain-containing protein n=1 Tax=Saitozyma podzolica TaxID=1890683 RepID=A0A427YWR8_9TREE|nr:hypothetical protein EHS25_000606 [Saitozyma podzolica]
MSADKSSSSSSTTGADPVKPKSPRNLVILCDGTGDQFSAHNSNVVKALSVLQADEQQLVYYTSGVGTVFASGTSMWGKIGHKISVLSDEAFAWSFGDFVCDAYKFLMDYHQTGDRVYIFGFSRGAYTARALAGMVQKVGLLPPGNHSQVKLAYEIYKTPNKDDREMAIKDKTMPLSTQYRRIFGISRPVVLHFVGVWDTVSSLGGVNLPRLPFASGVQAVTFFRQALALDERRARFKPEYRRLDKGEHPVDISKLAAKPKDGDDGTPRQNVECWFMGCHSDVGGGEDQNFTASLSNIPFRWMIREAAKCGIRLDASQIVCQPAFSDVQTVKDSGIIPEQLRKLLDEMSLSPVIDYDKEEAVRALIDEHLRPPALLNLVTMAAAYDTTLEGDVGAGAPISPDLEQLIEQSLTPQWYILELLPLETRTYTDTEETPHDHVQMNLFKGRQVITSQYIHRSVQKRFRYDKPLDGSTPTHSGKYGGPAAALPKEWGTTWEELRSGGPDIWED